MEHICTTNESRNIEQTSNWDSSTAMVQLFVPLLIWFSFLFTPIDERGDAGWQVFQHQPGLFFLWLGFLVSHAMLLVSGRRMAMPWWAGALFATIVVAVVNVGANQLITKESRFFEAYSRYPEFFLMSAAFAMVILWSSVLFLSHSLAKCLGAQWHQSSTSTDHSNRVDSDPFKPADENMGSAFRVIVPLLLWFAFLFLPLSEGVPGWVLFIPHPWVIHIWILFLIPNVLFFISIVCLANRSGGGALSTSLGSFAIVIGLTLMIFSDDMLQYPALLVLCGAHLVVVSWSIVQLRDDYLQRRNASERQSRSKPPTFFDPWAPSNS